MELCAELNTADSVGHIARVRGVVRARTSPKGHLHMSAKEGEDFAQRTSAHERQGGRGKGKREGSAVP